MGNFCIMIFLYSMVSILAGHRRDVNNFLLINCFYQSHRIPQGQLLTSWILLGGLQLPSSDFWTKLGQVLTGTISLSVWGSFLFQV